MNRRALLLSLILLAASLLAACGKQQWPEPVKSEDRFSIKTVKADRSGGCLALEITVAGAADNLASLTVQFMQVGDQEGMGCPGCPFRPSRAVSFEPGQAGLDRVGNVFRTGVCDLDPEGVYVWRVVAANRFQALGQTRSGLFSSWPR